MHSINADKTLPPMMRESQYFYFQWSFISVLNDLLVDLVADESILKAQIPYYHVNLMYCRNSMSVS